MAPHQHQGVELFSSTRRDLKRIDRQRVFGPNFPLFFNTSPNSNSPPLDSIIPTQVKTRNYLWSEDQENSVITTAWINTYTVYCRIRMCPVSSNFTFLTIIPCFWPLCYLIISENFDISCNNFAIIFVIIKLTTQTIFKSSLLELKDQKVSDPKVMLKLEFAKKKSLSLKLE